MNSVPLVGGWGAVAGPGGPWRGRAVYETHLVEGSETPSESSGLGRPPLQGAVGKKPQGSDPSALRYRKCRCATG